MDKKFALTAFGYALLGLLLGIYMAASKDHGQLVTHAHIMLLGFVTSFIYAVTYKLWLQHAQGAVVLVQYCAHQVGTAFLIAALFALYGGLLEESLLGPVLGVASLLVLAGMVLLNVLFIQAGRAAGKGAPATP